MKTKQMAILLLITGLLCLAAAAYLFAKKDKSQSAHSPVKDESVPSISAGKQKGNDFEDYVIARMCGIEGIKLMSKTSDYHRNGISAADNVEPDLKFSYLKHQFAIECKWRNAFVDGKLEWAKDFQIANYNKFEQEKGIKVLVAIGVGGSAGKPEQFYLVPLYRLKYSFAKMNYIKDCLIMQDVSILTTLNKESWYSSN